MRPGGKPYEFGEWFTAIYFQKKGYRVLLPKYPNPKNREKYVKAVKVLGKENVRWLWRKGRPDLLAYKGKRLCFVEVKVEGDRIRPSQRRMMKQILKRFRGSRIVVCYLRAKRPPG